MQNNKIYQIFPDPKIFLDKLFSSLENDKIDVSTYELDHICYRVESVIRYEELKKELKEIAELLSETIVSDRPIASYKLLEPLIYQDRKIFCLELPAPKENNMYKEGYEHAEFVIDINFEKFMQKHSNINFETKALEKKINPELVRKYSDHSVKFHHQTLEYVIKNLE
jgi:predicted metalloenzyme YecM